MAVEVYQRPASPYWYYKAPLLDKNGKVLDYERRSTKRKDKAEARLVAQQKIKEILDRSQHGVRDDPLLLGFMSDCVQATLAKGKSDYKNQKVFLDWLTPRLVKRQTRISQFDRSFMVQARRDFSLEGKSEGYCNNLMTFLISIYNQAKDLNLDVPHNQDFKGLKPRVATKTRYLMAGEEERLLHELDPKRSHAIAGYPKDWQERQERYPDMQRMLQDSHDLVCVLIDTGLRYTELTEGLWSSVDTVNFNYLNFYREKVGNEGHLVCTDRLSAIFERRWKTSGNSPYIFHHRNDPMKPRGYAPTATAKAIERADLNAPHLVKRYGRFTSMHSFRHTFASRLVQAGMSLYAVAGLLGHADVQMTQRYAHLAPQQDAQRAADILNGVQR